MAKIHIYRQQSFVAAGSALAIKIDAVNEHHILNGQKIVIEVAPGSHQIQIASFGISSETKQFALTDDQPLYLVTGVHLWATFALYVMSFLSVFSVAPFYLVFGASGLLFWLVFIILLLAGIFFSLRKHHYYLRQVDEAAYKRL